MSPHPPSSDLLPHPDNLPGVPKRVVFHWTAGGHQPTLQDRRHYHALIGWDGDVVTWHRGVPLANNMRQLSFDDPTFSGEHPEGYAAHTARLNSWSMGVALCGMRGAQEEPFDAGPEPIQREQVEAMVAFGVQLWACYGLEPVPMDMLGHYEVPSIYGVPQPGKWDPSWLPVDTSGAASAMDWVRSKIRERRQADGD